MTDQEKIDFIIDKLNQDQPTTSVGKIMKAVLMTTVPTLQTAQLDQIMTVLSQ